MRYHAQHHHGITGFKLDGSDRVRRQQLTSNASGDHDVRRARQRQPDGNGTLGGSEHRELVQETAYLEQEIKA